MNRTLLPTICLLVALTACKTDEPTPATQAADTVEADAAAQLATGSDADFDAVPSDLTGTRLPTGESNDAAAIPDELDGSNCELPGPPDVSESNFVDLYVPDIPLDAGTAAGCGPGQFMAGTECKPASCSAVSEYMTAAMHDVVTGNQTCIVDSDCGVVDVKTSCTDKCPIAIQTGTVAAVQSLVAQFETTICKPLQFASVCKTDKIVAVCPVSTPGCVKGFCSASKKFPSNDCPLPGPANATCYATKWVCNPGFVLPPEAPDCIPTTCSALLAAAEVGLAAAASGATKECVSDLDCVPISLGTTCGLQCPTAIHKAWSAVVGAKISAWDTFCKGLSLQNNCLTPSLTTCPPKYLNCAQGRCEYSKGTP